MKMNELVKEVQEDIDKLKRLEAKEILRERLQEVMEIKRAAAVAEKQLNELLEMDIDDVVE